MIENKTESFAAARDSVLIKWRRSVNKVYSIPPSLQPTVLRLSMWYRTFFTQVLSSWRR